MAILKPFNWVQDYSKNKLKGDFFAGLTVGALLIPQSMAYALIAGLPVIYGLYASIVPQVIYAFFGSSNRLSVGPTAMDSLLIGSGLVLLASIGSKEYIELAIILSLLVGIIQALLGFMKMGFITQLLSRPIISGFTSAAAILIGLNQLGPLLGIQIDKGNLPVLLNSVFNNIIYTDLLTALIGLISIVSLFAFKKWIPKIPGNLIIVLSSILLVQYFELHILNLKVVGEISKGLPSFNIPNLNWNKISSLLPLASTLAVISFIESFSISKKIDTKSRDYKLNANTELVALGSANFIGSFFMSFPVTGGFGRSAVNYTAGAQTPFSGFISASLIATTLLFFTDIFELLPYTVLAAIILVALAGLIDFKYPHKLWKANSIDFFLLILTFLITLLFGMISGVFSGMFLYVLLLTYKLFFPQVHHQTFAKTEGKLPTNNMSIASPHKSLYIFKIDTPVFTFNSKSIKKQIIQKIIIPNSNRQTLLIDLSTIQHIDGRGLKGIKLLISELYEKNIRILWLKLHPKIHSIFTYKKLINGPLENNVFKNVTAAMEFLKKENDK